MTHTTSTRNPTEERALKLLGSGLGPEVVASAVGVSVSRISQLLSEKEFADEVSTLRFNSLSKHTVRDESYDSLEDSLLQKLRQSLPLMHKPFELLRAIQVINGAKRRGVSSPTTTHNQQTVVNITLPTQIVQRFTTNAQNQVIHAGSQELLTIQSSQLEKLSSERISQSIPKELYHETESSRNEGNLANC